MRTTIVYRIYNDAGELLYVGYSKAGLRRVAQHANKEWWPEVAMVRIEHFDNRMAALRRENDLLVEGSARHNIAGPRVYMDFSGDGEPVDPERLMAAVADWRTARDEEREARAQFSTSIREARSNGTTLRELAESLGVSRQRVQQLSDDE